MDLTPALLPDHTQSSAFTWSLPQLFPKNPIKTAARWLHSGCDWWVWTGVQPDHHLSAVCLHAQALAVCWTETEKQRGKPNWKQQDAAEPFPLLQHVCRILNNILCEKYSCYSKSGRMSHLCPENSSNRLTEVYSPSHSSPVTNRGRCGAGTCSDT